MDEDEMGVENLDAVEGRTRYRKRKREIEMRIMARERGAVYMLSVLRRRVRGERVRSACVMIASM